MPHVPWIVQIESPGDSYSQSHHVYSHGRMLQTRQPIHPVVLITELHYSHHHPKEWNLSSTSRQTHESHYGKLLRTARTLLKFSWLPRSPCLLTWHSLSHWDTRQIFSSWVSQSYDSCHAYHTVWICWSWCLIGQLIRGFNRCSHRRSSHTEYSMCQSFHLPTFSPPTSLINKIEIN